MNRMNTRYFIYLAYNGTRFCGWQNQPNGISVQQSIEDALFKLFQRKMPIVGAGRTDSGVHARLMVAHFDINHLITDLDRLIEKLNKILPKDIVIYRIVPVREDAHARFDAIKRKYQYYVSSVKQPFSYEWIARMSTHCQDIKVMNEAAQLLLEYTDFTSFSKLHTDVKTNNCTIDIAEWYLDGDVWVFTIQANRFLRNMVRAIVGTLWEVGRGKRTVDDFRTVIEAKNRSIAGSSAPAEGLALIDVIYPEEIFLI